LRSEDKAVNNARLAGSQLDTLVIGGGPAGTAAAIHLARSGRAVALIEQSIAAQHKVCGEFLSHEAIAYLSEIGIDLQTLGAVRIHAVRLAANHEIATCDLPFPAFSLTRRTLDESLLNLAAAAGADVTRGCRVDSFSSWNGRFAVQLSSGASQHARDLFLATGKHDVSSHRRPRGHQNDLVAFKMYFRLRPAQQRALQGLVEIYLFPGGYAGLQLVEENAANLCLLVNRATLQRCGNSWTTVLEHLRSSSDLLAQRLDDAQPLLPKPLALSTIPYGMLRSDATAGLWALGDQTAVISSFSGDGVSIALHSAKLAADLYLNSGTSAELTYRLRRELRHSVGIATTLSRLMIAAPALAHAARMWPALLATIASRTRIPMVEPVFLQR
jgi:menaquinone-9 beta-reductase